MDMEIPNTLDNAKKELSIEEYVEVTYTRKTGRYEREVIFRHDLPRRMLDKWRWVLEWRKARLICRYPKDSVQMTFCFYDKKTGEAIELDSCLGKLIASKAQVTRQEKAIERYIAQNRDNMFFDEATDEPLIKLRAKLEIRKSKLKEIEEQYRNLQKTLT